MGQGIDDAMIFANIYAEGHSNNSLFGLDDVVHRYNPTYTPRLLRQEFLKLGIELNTPDLNQDREIAFDLYAEGRPLKPRARPRYLVAMENPYINKLNADRNYCLQFDLVFAWDIRLHDLVNVIPTMIPHPMQWKESPSPDQRSIFSCLINANKSFKDALPTDLYAERINTIRWYERNAPEKFALYGMGWEKPPPEFTPIGRVRRSIARITDLILHRPAFPSYQGELNDKAEVLRQSRFSYCYENSRGLNNYITEKIFDSMVNGCIPVYWGADNVLDYIPACCFIDRRQFKSTSDTHRYLVQLSDSKCHDYQQHIKEFLLSQEAAPFKTKHVVQQIVSKIAAQLDSAN